MDESKMFGGVNTQENKPIKASDRQHTREEYDAVGSNVEYLLMRKEDATYAVNSILKSSGGDINLVSPAILGLLAMRVKELEKIYTDLAKINSKGEKSGFDGYHNMEEVGLESSAWVEEDVDNLLKNRDNVREVQMKSYTDFMKRRELELSKKTYIDGFYEDAENGVNEKIEALDVMAQLLKHKGDLDVHQKLIETIEEIKKDWQDQSGPRLNKLIEERKAELGK